MGTATDTAAIVMSWSNQGSRSLQRLTMVCVIARMHSEHASRDPARDNDHSGGSSLGGDTMHQDDG